MAQTPDKLKYRLLSVEEQEEGANSSYKTEIKYDSQGRIVQFGNFFFSHSPNQIDTWVLRQSEEEVEMLGMPVGLVDGEGHETSDTAYSDTILLSSLILRKDGYPSKIKIYRGDDTASFDELFFRDSNGQLDSLVWGDGEISIRVLWTNNGRDMTYELVGISYIGDASAPLPDAVTFAVLTPPEANVLPAYLFGKGTIPTHLIRSFVEGNEEIVRFAYRWIDMQTLEVKKYEPTSENISSELTYVLHYESIPS